VHADQTSGLASELLGRVRADIEAIPLPPGYTMEFGGEYEDSSQAQAALAGTLPAFVLLMVLIVVCLFNSLRITLIIWLTVPLSLIGIVVGLLVFDQPFGFMALLGALSLSGMLIKNAIVLIDEINTQLRSGLAGWDALILASVSRVRPVLMAALTTVFGLIPLLFDVFFGAMAVTIVVGLFFLIRPWSRRLPRIPTGDIVVHSVPFPPSKRLNGSASEGTPRLIPSATRKMIRWGAPDSACGIPAMLRPSRGIEANPMATVFKASLRFMCFHLLEHPAGFDKPVSLVK